MYACILAALYTANLTAIFASGDDAPYVPGSIDELISKIPPDIPFGAFNNTQTTEYLQNSSIQDACLKFEYIKGKAFCVKTHASQAFTAALHKNIAIITYSI